MNLLKISISIKNLVQKSCFRCLSTKIYENTIYALCSGQGKCGVSVIRVSGKDAREAITKLTHFKEPPKPRYTHLVKIRHPQSKEILDKGLVLWFPSPNSFTGEDVCEFQVHGGTAIVSSILLALETLNNFRLAKPGEFTKRAFYNKKMDLIEAEGLADLINAETELQRKQAFIQSQGTLSKLYREWSDSIRDCLINFESLFNFENIEEYESDRILEDIKTKIDFVHKEIIGHLDDKKRGEKLRTGVQTVILGEANVGKSSLYNFLCKRNAAIVTPYPGTTRDTLETCLDVEGYPIILFDTCGIRHEKVDPIEAEGIRITLDKLKSADLIVLMIDIEKYVYWIRRNEKGTAVDFIKNYVIHDLKLPDILNENENELNKLFKVNSLVVLNKLDKIESPLRNLNGDVFTVSITNNKGMDLFVLKLKETLKDLCANPSVENPAITKIRHRSLLEKSEKHLRKFLETVREQKEHDYGLLGNDLRYALKFITEIIEGRSDNSPVVDVLDEIFHNFCIGK